MVNIQSPTAEIREEKKERKKEERNRMKIYMVSLLDRATIIMVDYMDNQIRSLSFLDELK